jgi:Zn-dependent protease
MDAMTILNYAIIIGFLIMSLSFHEFAHAYVAYLRGDMTPKLAGRLTLNPINHIDPIGLLVLLLTRKIGWMKPVPINMYGLKEPRRISIILVALAGPVANIILSFIFFFLVKIFAFSPFWANIFLQVSMINLFLAAFNLFFLPPLDGYRIFASLAFENPEDLFANHMIEMYGSMFLMLIIFLFPSVLNKWVEIVVSPLWNLMVKLFY